MTKINEQAFINIKAGNLNKLKLLLQHNPRLLNEKAPDTWSLLQCAVAHYQSEIALYLIKKGCALCSINRDNLTALKLARQNRLHKITSILLNNGATK